MQQPIDDNNEKQFQYISSLLRGKGEPFYLPDGTPLYPNILNVNMPFETMHIFAERYNNGEILCPYKYENYINDKDLQATINGLQMDADAFWLLAIFCFDFACNVCLSGFTIKDSARRTIEKFINLAPDDEDSTMKLTIKTDKGKMEIEDNHAITYILKWVKQAYEQNEDAIHGWTAEEAKDIFNLKEESNSVLIWYFARLMREFFELNPQFEGKRKKGETVSLNKNLLISKLIYHTHLSTNENFKFDAESLKGFFKQYKNKQIITHSDIYY